jgi:hypothetical protein
MMNTKAPYAGISKHAIDFVNLHFADKLHPGDAKFLAEQLTAIYKEGYRAGHQAGMDLVLKQGEK